MTLARLVSTTGRASTTQEGIQMEAIKASKVKLGDYLVNLGYVSAIEASPTNICFALRTKPDSPTGLLRGAPAGTLNLDPDDLVLFRDH